MDVVRLACILDPAYEVWERIDVFLTHSPTKTKLAAVTWKTGCAWLDLME